MNSEATMHFAGRSARGVIVAGAAWLLAYLASRLMLDAMAPPPYWDIVVASLPIFAFYWFVWVVIRALKDIDELARRIHLEALALAFSTAMLVLMMLGLLDSPAGALGIPFREVWIVMPVIYGICLAVVTQRYR